MTPEIQAFAAGFPTTLAHAGLSLLMLLVGALDTADFSRSDFTDTVSNSFGWSLLLFVLAIGGIVIQVMQRALMRRSIQETWYAESRTVAPR